MEVGEPPAPRRLDFQRGDGRVDALVDTVLLTAENDVVRLLSGCPLEFLDQNLRHTDEPQDLLGEVGSGATVAQKGVGDVNDEASLGVEDGEPTEAVFTMIVVPEEFDAGGKPELIRAEVLLAFGERLDAGEDDLELLPGEIGGSGDGRQRTVVSVSLPCHIAIFADGRFQSCQEGLVVRVRCG